MHRRKHAFTLIELLVVVAIIALLIAILLPSLGKVRERARATVCLSNLRNMGLSMVLYYQNNNFRFPTVTGTSPPTGGNDTDWIAWRTDQWKNLPNPAPVPNVATRGIGPYLLGSPGATRILFCPSDDPNNTRNFSFSYELNFLTSSEPSAPQAPAGTICGSVNAVRRPGECIVFYEEDETSINDNWAQLWSTGIIDRLAIRHDRARITTADPAGAKPYVPNYKGKGNVAFVDGHAEFVPRTFADSKEHAVPVPESAAAYPDPPYTDPPYQ